MHPTELTLTNIDSMRHMATSEEVVRAVGFAVRAGCTDHTAHRFVAALVIVGSLRFREDWPEVLTTVVGLEGASDR